MPLDVLGLFFSLLKVSRTRGFLCCDLLEQTLGIWWSWRKPLLGQTALMEQNNTPPTHPTPLLLFIKGKQD